MVLQKIDLDMKFIWGWNDMVHTTRRQDLDHPISIFIKWEVFCPCLKKSLSWYTLKKKNGSLNSWASPAENNSDASAKTHQTNSDPSSNSRYYQPLLATFIYHPMHLCHLGYQLSKKGDKNLNIVLDLHNIEENPT